MARTASTAYLRGTGAAHHLLSITRSEQPEVLAVTFNSASRKDVDALAGSVRAHGGSIPQTPAAIDDLKAAQRRIGFASGLKGCLTLRAGNRKRTPAGIRIE